MGIPRFLAFLKKTYPKLEARRLEKSMPKKAYVEGLYIDVNTIIHSITQELFKYGSNYDRELTAEELVVQNYFRNLSTENREYIVFRCVGRYLAYCYDMVQAEDTFMIAIDGVAPKAKMSQQRSRRVKSAGSVVDFFDLAVISPGTKFMDDLNQYITVDWPVEFAHLLQSKPGLTIIYSSHREPGEGEHKIFQQMTKDLRGDERVRLLVQRRVPGSIPYQVVVGADSDLMILSLAKNANIVFMRENFADDSSEKDDAGKSFKIGPLRTPIESTILSVCKIESTGQQTTKLEQAILDEVDHSWKYMFDNEFQYFNLSEFRNNLIKDYMAPNDVMDFVFMSLFVGNDFLPAIPEFETVTTMAVTYRTYEDIEIRFKRDGYDFLKDRDPKLVKRQGGRGRGNINFTPDMDVINQNTRFKRSDLNRTPQKNSGPGSFRDEFRLTETTWQEHKDRNGYPYWTGDGIWNNTREQLEMYPSVVEPLTGEKRRIVLIKAEGETRWTVLRRDIGALAQCLRTYSNLMRPLKARGRGTGNTYIIEKKNQINYSNLLDFLKAMATQSVELMESHASRYLEIEKKQREGMNVTPDPMIKLAIGQEQVGRKYTGSAFVPSAFSTLQRAVSFGIYDSEYADPRLPKVSNDEMCRKWLEGAMWTLKYYSDGLNSINTQWFYPYLHSPTLPDLIQYIEKNLIISIESVPGIAYSSFDRDVEYEKINVQGTVGYISRPNPFAPDPNSTEPYEEMVYEKVTDTSLEGTIYVYYDNAGKQIALFRTRSGESKYIDLNRVYFTKPIKKILRKGATNTVGGVNIIESDIEDIHPVKLTFIETGRETRKSLVRKTFPLAASINTVISDLSHPYASVLESLFSILPIRLLYMMMSPTMVNFVCDQIKDCFPETVETIAEGKYYEGQEVPKLPIPSPTRLQRIIETIPKEYDFEISKFNESKPRQIIYHRETPPRVGPVKARHKHAQGYSASNVESHSRKVQKQAGEASGVKVSPNVTGGIGDALGMVLPQYAAEYNQRYPRPPKKQYTMITSVTPAGRGTTPVGRGRGRAGDLMPVAGSNLPVVLTPELVGRGSTIVGRGSTIVGRGRGRGRGGDLTPVAGVVGRVVACRYTPLEEAENAKILSWGALTFQRIAFDNIPMNIPYKEHCANDNVHIGQRKLLLNMVIFLTKYGLLSRDVLYIGAARGQNIAILSQLFPYHVFHLWDPNDFAIKESQTKQGGSIKIRRSLFTDESVREYAGRNVLFVSDIRSGVASAGGEIQGKEEQEEEQQANDIQQANIPEWKRKRGKLTSDQMIEFEKGVDDNNKMQARWLLDVNPVASMLKFRLPFTVQGDYPYLHGTVDLQPWAPAKSAETRLIVTRDDAERSRAELKMYNSIMYENRMYYYNNFIRAVVAYVLPFDNIIPTGRPGPLLEKVKGLKGKYDCMYEIDIWIQYIMSRPNSQMFTPDFVTNAVVLIMNLVSNNLGYDLNGQDISKGVSYANRPLFVNPIIL